MKKIWIWILIFVSILPLCAETDLLKELESARQKRKAAAEETAVTERELESLKLAVKNQQNIVRQKKLILDGKDPAIAGKELREAASRKTVVWDRPLKEKKEVAANCDLPAGVSFVEDGGRMVMRSASETPVRAYTLTFFSAQEMQAMRGKKVQLSVMIKGKNIKGNATFCLWATRPKPYEDIWPDCKSGEGTFEWRKAVFTAEIPADAGSGAVLLGLAGGSGEVFYKDLKVELFADAER